MRIVSTSGLGAVVGEIILELSKPEAKSFYKALKNQNQHWSRRGERMPVYQVEDEEGRRLYVHFHEKGATLGRKLIYKDDRQEFWFMATWRNASQVKFRIRAKNLEEATLFAASEADQYQYCSFSEHTNNFEIVPTENPKAAK